MPYWHGTVVWICQKLPGLMWIRSWQLSVSPVLIAKVACVCRSIPFGALNANFRVPSSVDYTSMLRLTGFMTRDVREILKAYERCVFNVIFHNRDDHAKNFSFRMNDRGHWRFSPAYGLTFSEGPGGEHQMDICGEGRTPAKADLLKLASQTNIKRVDAIAAIERISAVAADFTKTARRFPIRKATVEQIAKKIDTNRSRMA
ncbi:hypothetical protein R69919_05005 [Paraburkholderia gardini]|nr:hypothetical protein R69919_05005 [Paraburkholderia gardini]